MTIEQVPLFAKLVNENGFCTETWAAWFSRAACRATYPKPPLHARLHESVGLSEEWKRWLNGLAKDGLGMVGFQDAPTYSPVGDVVVNPIWMDWLIRLRCVEEVTEVEEEQAIDPSILWYAQEYLACKGFSDSFNGSATQYLTGPVGTYYIDMIVDGVTVTIRETFTQIAPFGFSTVSDLLINGLIVPLQNQYIIATYSPYSRETKGIFLVWGSFVIYDKNTCTITWEERYIDDYNPSLVSGFFVYCDRYTCSYKLTGSETVIKTFVSTEYIDIANFPVSYIRLV